jgi:ELWxxDGT repeat protein
MGSAFSRPGLRRTPRLEPLEPRRVLSANFDLLADLNRTPVTEGSNPHSLTAVGDKLFFYASTPTHGDELWVSDGTEAGTRLVKDIRPGPESSTQFTNPPSMANVGGKLFFTANDGIHGNELWTSDGTAAGTHLVRDLWEGPNDGVDSWADIVDMEGIAYFQGRYALWRSDGTEAGTMLIMASTDGVSINPQDIVNVGGTLYFSGGSNATGRELWRSDGTTAGTMLVKDIWPFGPSSSPRHFTNVGGVLYFAANDGTTGYEIWRSDGTTDGTVLVKEVHVGGPYSSPEELTNVGGRLFFIADDGVHGREVWSTDGTAEGTLMTRDVHPDVDASSFFTGPTRLTGAGATAYFVGDDGVTGYEIWRTDGTEVGTTVLTDSNENGSIFQAPSDLTNIGGVLYFNGNGGSLDGGLWRSDGTPSGTVQILARDGNPIWSVNNLTALDGHLFFTANEGANGPELWRSDGTPAGTHVVRDIRGGTRGSNFGGIQRFGESLYFTASTDSATSPSTTQTWRVWTSSPRAPLEIDYIPEVRRIGPSIQHQGALFFSASDESYDFELWTIDNAIAAPRFVKNLRTFLSSGPDDFLSFGNSLYFTAFDDELARSLWRTDGTDSGTVRVKAFAPGGGAFGLTALDDAFFFLANDGIHGVELWKSDGTEAGTVLVKDISPGPSDSAPQHLTVLDNYIYFWADDGAHGYELWRSDGTPEDTVLVRDIRPGPESSFERFANNILVRSGDALVFRADDGVAGSELWRSDGTFDGSWRVRDVRPGADSSTPDQLTAVGDLVFFTAHDADHGIELWRTDGTIEGTHLVRDILPGPEPQLRENRPTSLANVDGALYFAADDGLHGVELWTSDSTEGGTQLVYDFTGDAASSRPTSMTRVGGRLLVVAESPDYGRELWVERLPLPGDYDGNGQTDGNDFLVWQRQLGTKTPAELGADGNGNLLVDAGDLGVWSDHYGATPGISSALAAAVLAEPAATSKSDLPIPSPWRGGSTEHGRPEVARAQMVPFATQSGRGDAPGTRAANTEVIDALFAAGDFTSLFQSTSDPLRPRGYRPPRRG